MFAEKLKKLRKEKGITQIDLAKILNVANGTIGNWESGNRQPDYITLQKIADYFNVSVDYLLGRADKKNDDIVFDDFTYAMYHESENLTTEQKEALLNMAKLFNENTKEEYTFKAVAETTSSVPPKVIKRKHT